ncbi:hypothetical protein G4O51_01435 [Candidatus Bathyarchaeota archaeon A05DMB-2]|nr:hypothetical protein [Candidatus Bathyarchaeota archaeon A05DMB-2]
MKRRGRGSYAVNKPLILGVVKWKGPVRLIPMRDVATRSTLVRRLKNFDLDDLDAFYTDEYPPTTS